MLQFIFTPIGIIVVVILLFVIYGVRILKEYERIVVFRLGRVASALWNPGGTGSGPGLTLIIPFIDKTVRVSLRTITMDVPPQDVITKDNVSVKVNAIVYFRVIDWQKAIIQVEDFLYATSQIAQTSLRSVLGQSQLDDLLSKREEVNAELQRIIDLQTEPWGIKVSVVEVKNVDLPQEMVRAIAKQAEAERERRAKVIHALGEFEAAQKLSEAADIISVNPTTLQLRYLQTLTEISSEKSTTVVFPVPIDLFTALTKRPTPGS